MNDLHEFKIHYGVNNLAGMQKSLRKIINKIDPSSTPENRHWSIEESYAARELLREIDAQISMLKGEVDDHTGPEVKKSLVQKLLRK